MKKNGYAALVRKRSAGVVKRRRRDDYETPDEDTRALTNAVSFAGPILEPACGSGRMVRALRRETGRKVYGSDIKTGKNFLARVAQFDGDIVTNPAYRDGLADQFAEHALKIASGKVAMLMQSGFLWGEKRSEGLYQEYKPALVIVIPHRIYFLVKGQPLDSQFFTHCWIVWPRRSERAQQRTTQIIWGVA